MKTLNFQTPNLARTIDFSAAAPDHIRSLLKNQWLISNGLGGYASGTISGAVTWRYHGLLIAALPAPHGRILMFNHLTETLCFSDRPEVQFGGAEPSHPEERLSLHCLKRFELRNQLPVWSYEIDGVVVEKRLLMPYLQNTVHISYHLLSEHDGLELMLRPSFQFRPFEGSVNTPLSPGYELRVRGARFEVDSHEGYPPLKLIIDHNVSRFVHDGGSTREMFYERDSERGYESHGVLWSPGYFSVPLAKGAPVTLIASTEDWHIVSALDPQSALAVETERRHHLLRLANPHARSGPAAELVLAADQFIMVPAGRIKDAARARAAGDELRSVIAGYHWFTDWGRDTMISLEGLTLTTGRFQEAAWILRTFAHYVRRGLIPNMFPEGQNEGLYHTADATLWFFHALHRYIQATGDRETLGALLPVIRSIIDHHVHGTDFGIKIDPKDGLLHQGAESYQLTWMDAKVGNWVVTPRRGKAVEINALWYNAVCLAEEWFRQEGHNSVAAEFAEHARRARESFNRRFWNPAANCLFDIVDGENGNDPAIRPNQLLSISLTHPVLAPEYWRPVLQIAEEKLLTPVGLRSLSREHPDYKTKYFGDIRARDAAYHQGTVWAWLIGPFIDAWLKVHPDQKKSARRFLEGLLPHLNEGCIGSISEVFDAEPPFTQRGCIAQAWSVAEVLRCFVLTCDEPHAR